MVGSSIELNIKFYIKLHTLSSTLSFTIMGCTIADRTRKTTMIYILFVRLDQTGIARIELKKQPNATRTFRTMPRTALRER